VNQRGASSILGLLAIFAATAVLLTVVMLFATGVAQRTLIPRLQQRAESAVPPVPAPTAEAEPLAGAAETPAEPAAPAVDSLRILRSQLRLEEERLELQAAAVRDLLDEWTAQREALDAESAQRVAEMAKVYSGMKPAAAAAVLVRLDDEVFEQVLAQLDKRQAGKILAQIDPARVARLTQRMAARETGPRNGAAAEEAR
jgi:flagellar motility protein MotE (MotC chaperone)